MQRIVVKVCQVVFVVEVVQLYRLKKCLSQKIKWTVETVGLPLTGLTTTCSSAHFKYLQH